MEVLTVSIRPFVGVVVRREVQLLTIGPYTVGIRSDTDADLQPALRRSPLDERHNSISFYVVQTALTPCKDRGLPRVGKYQLVILQCLCICPLFASLYTSMLNILIRHPLFVFLDN